MASPKAWTQEKETQYSNTSNEEKVTNVSSRRPQLSILRFPTGLPLGTLVFVQLLLNSLG